MTLPASVLGKPVAILLASALRGPVFGALRQGAAVLDVLDVLQLVLDRTGILWLVLDPVGVHRVPG